MTMLAERYRRLHALHRFVIDRLSRAPFRWGWGNGPAAVDVIGADDRGVTLTADRQIPWNQVGTAQMLKFARHTVRQIEGDRGQMAERRLDMAIFCYETGMAADTAEERDRALEIARELVRKAAELRGALRDEADRLMPALTNPDPPPA